MPYVTLLAHITPRLKILIYSIFFNEVNEAAIFWNLITDISDHHAHVLITPKILKNDPSKVRFRRSFKNLINSKLFKNNLLKNDWKSLLRTKLNVNFSFEKFLLELNNLFDLNATFKYSKCKNKKHKPWITNSITNSIREIIRKINYAEQRTLKERKNFTIYTKPIKIMLPTFLKEAEKQRIHLKRIRKTHTKFARK